jgi:hypothetical protein
MAYVQTGLSGLSAIRLENGNGGTRSTGYVPPAPIIGQTVQPIVPLPIKAPDIERVIIGGNGVGPVETWGRGFVPVVREIIGQTVVPGAPTYEVDDSRIERRLLPSILPAETRVPIVSEPTDAARAKLAFELAEAKKWGYTHAAWMALGAMRRGDVRAKYPDGYKPVMRNGVSAEAARIDLVAGRDPIRSRMHESGAGDYPGGIEIADPQSTVSLVSTKTGVTFDDILRVDPLKIQTPAEAAGLVPGEAPLSTQNIMRYGFLAVAGWVLWNAFLKPRRRISRRSRRTVRPARRRKYPHVARKRHLRLGSQ